MQLTSAILLSIPLLSLVSCAEPKRILTLKLIDIEKPRASHIAKVSESNAQSFLLEYSLGHNKQSFFIHTDRILGTPLIMRRNETTEVFQFPPDITDPKQTIFHQDRLYRTNHEDASLSSESPGKQSPKGYKVIRDDNTNVLPVEENIYVKEGNIVVALMPMSNETNKSLRKKCTPAKIASSYAKSKETLIEARISAAISKNCKEGTVVPIVIQYKVEVEKTENIPEKWANL